MDIEKRQQGILRDIIHHAQILSSKTNLQFNPKYIYIRIKKIDHVHPDIFTKRQQKIQQLSQIERDHKKYLSPMKTNKSSTKNSFLNSLTSPNINLKTHNFSNKPTERKINVTFKLSNKQSATVLKTTEQGKDFTIDNNGVKISLNPDMTEQTHLFCYQAEEVLRVILKQHHEDGKNQGENEIYHGFLKVLVTPFVQLPHTCHRITLNMPFQQPNNMIRKKQQGNQKSLGAKMTIQLFYLFNFSAKIQIKPLSANLIHNTSIIGQMSPGVKFILQDQIKKSLVQWQGGIHPDWQDYARIRRQECYQGQEETKARTKQDKKNRKTKKQKQMEQKQKEYRLLKQQLTNNFTFDLNSVGHELKIQVINFPFIGADAVLIGENTIKMESMNFFTNPGKQMKYQGKNGIKLYYKTVDNKNQFAGTLNLQTKFIFDHKQIRRQIQSSDEEQDI